MADLRFDARFDLRNRLAGFLKPALLCQPTRGFGDAPADEPNSNRAESTQKNHPAPPRHAKRRARNQNPRGQSDAWDCQKLDALIDSEGTSPEVSGRELRDVGIDGHDFHPDSQA